MLRIQKDGLRLLVLHMLIDAGRDAEDDHEETGQQSDDHRYSSHHEHESQKTLENIHAAVSPVTQRQAMSIIERAVSAPVHATRQWPEVQKRHKRTPGSARLGHSRIDAPAWSYATIGASVNSA